MNEAASAQGTSQDHLTEAEVQDLLQRRADRLSERLVAKQEEASIPVAEFPLGGERYALPMSAVRAAVPLRTLTAMPLSPLHVVGILRFEGQILTAFSCASLLGCRGWSADPSVLLVLELGSGGLVALDCEQVPVASAVPLAQLEAARGPTAGALLALTSADGRPLNFIELDRLLESVSPGAPHGG